ncbi:hypothetical protein BKA61DRAFT_584533 [Leptodontidium sp. MPI-SDFR-AT-0119]|nr:hypothetical protein BKA61DRAFT_584533 [Leptodontidium sp. MPI-SDFR-AT-0119]
MFALLFFRPFFRAFLLLSPEVSVSVARLRFVAILRVISLAIPYITPRYTIVLSDINNSVRYTVLAIFDFDVLEGLGEVEKISQLVTLTVIRPAKLKGLDLNPFQSESSSSNPPFRANISPIKLLSPYAPKWIIKARVVYKSKIRYFETMD